MRTGKPVKLRRGPLGGWFVTRGEKPSPHDNGMLTADTRFIVENGAELDKLIEQERQEAAREALEAAAADIEIDMGRGFTGADDHTATAAAEVWLRHRAENIGAKP